MGSERIVNNRRAITRVPPWKRIKYNENVNTRTITDADRKRVWLKTPGNWPSWFQTDFHPLDLEYLVDANRNQWSYKWSFISTMRWEAPLWKGKPITSRLVSRAGPFAVTVTGIKRVGKRVDVTFTIVNRSVRAVKPIAIRLKGIGVVAGRSVRIPHLGRGKVFRGTLSTTLSARCDSTCRAWNRNRPIHLEITYGGRYTRRAPAGYADYYGWRASFDDNFMSFVYAPDKTAGYIARVIATKIKSKRIRINSYRGRVLAAKMAYDYLVRSGVRYVSDSLAPLYINYNTIRAIPHYQFPAETFYRGGDCEDLATLYAAILYRMGIKVGIVMRPRHVTTLVRIGNMSRKVDKIKVGGRVYPLVHLRSHRGASPGRVHPKYLAVDVTGVGEKSVRPYPFKKVLSTSTKFNRYVGWWRLATSGRKRNTRHSFLLRAPTIISLSGTSLNAAQTNRYKAFPWLGKVVVKRRP